MNSPQKPQESKQNVPKSRKIVNNASTKEIVVIIAKKQEEQSKQLFDLTIQQVKLEQKVNDFINDCKSDKAKDDARTVNQQGNIKWIITTVIGLVFAILGWAWSVFK